MERLIQKILEINPIVVLFAILLFAFVPVSCLVLVKKINRWVKTLIVLVFGELGAVILFVLAKAAKTAGTGNILAEFIPFAIVFAIVVLFGAVLGHIFGWESRTVKF